MLTHRQLFLHHVAQTSTSPLMLEIVRAEGTFLYDASGKKYVDLISGIAVSNLGHRDPVVVQAIKDQLDKYMHLMVYGEYVQSPQTLLAKAISDLLPSELSSVYFVNSGTEAVEGALKLAKRYTGRSEIIAFKHGYHGSTHGALSLMSDEYFKNAFRPLLPGISYPDYNDMSSPGLINDKTACVVLEIIQGEAGAIPGDPEFLRAVRKKCTETGALLIVDEIQTGFGRTGSFFAFEQVQITPDILLLAKGMGGGMPIGAFISTNAIMQTLAENPVLGHITTFGGHPVCCAASLATMQQIQKLDIASIANRAEEMVRNILIHPSIKAVSGKGLMLAVGFEDAELNQNIIRKCIQTGVITDWFLFAPERMRIAPPLTISSDDLHDSLKVILDAVKSCS